MVAGLDASNHGKNRSSGLKSFHIKDREVIIVEEGIFISRSTH